MKAFKKLIPAIAMLLVSAVLLGTSTFAWFSMNTKVTVTGMSVTTKVNSNLLISADTTESHFTTAITQDRSALIEPASTIDGAAFWYTTDALANGAKAGAASWVAYSEGTALTNADTYAVKSNYDAAFNTAYGIGTANPNPLSAAGQTAYAYVDYTFYVKATSVQDSQKLSLTLCRLLYNNQPVTDRAWRVAIFSTTGEATAAAADGETATLKTILSPTGATYQTSGQAVNAATTTAAVTNLNTAATLDGTVNANDVKYYKIIARLFLEGEDTTCTNATYASLTNAWTLDLAIELGAATGTTHVAVSKAEVTNAANVASVTVNTGEDISAYSWKKASDNTELVTTATYTNSTGSALDVYCEVTTGGGVYRSNTITVPAS